MTRSYFKHNKVQTFELITPRLYLDEDISLSGLQVKVEQQLINTHLLLANSFQSVLNIPELSTVEAVSPYFVKQNKLTYITPFSFEADILLPLGVTYSNFATCATFRNYVSGQLLPTLILNSPTAFTHDYLTSKLGWFYFLNTNGASFSPSTYVTEKLTELYFGTTLNLNDGIKGLVKHLWYNYPTYIPADYVSGAALYTSGTQQLSKLNTLVDIVYSPLTIDIEDFTVRDAFDDYISTQTLMSDLESKGPYYKLLKAISYGMHDIDDEIQGINDLYDLEKCPDRLLPMVAELIGWHLFGSDPSRWRLQLRNAVELYKAKGTKLALQGAIDAIFSEGFLNLSGGITELYESYIPNLIFYSLATASPLFSSFESWTPSLANSLGVNGFSPQSLEVNIRYAVDSILLETVKKFPNSFKLGGKPWNLNDIRFRFNYRNKINVIPPFEDWKYYKDTEVTTDMIDFIADKIACFGIQSSYIESFIEFIKERTIESTSLFELDNRWLFFYVGLQLPPNYDEILSTFDKVKFKYAGLWSGKSSHFNLNLYASSYTYSQKSLEASSTAVLNEALRAIHAFAPANAIPDINFLLNTDDYADFDTLEHITYDYEQNDYLVSSQGLIAYQTSGVNMSSLNKRFTRFDVDSLNDFAYSTSVGIGRLPRTNQRRRNLHNILPTNRLYSRTGFNMPVITQPSTLEYYGGNTGFTPLGYIPSTNAYVPIPEVTSLPAVYTKCENLRSGNTYNGVVTSATFPARGRDRYTASAFVNYSTRGDTNRLFGIISKILFNREKKFWSDYLDSSAGFAQYRLSKKYLDLPTSLANSSFVLSSFLQFENFEFSVGIHRVYNDWVTYFQRANINENSLLLSGGKDLFSHAFGPLLYNGKFDMTGSALTVSAQLVNSGYDNTYTINNDSGDGVLSLAGSTINTFTRSGDTTNSIHIGGEYVNSAILKNVEFIGTSGASQENLFQIFNINGTLARAGYRNYPVKNPIVKTKSIDGFPRLTFRLSSSDNILIPGHEFKLQLKYFAGFESGDKYGGAQVGVWIHTEPVEGMVWSWTKNGKWQMMTLPSALGLNDIQPYFITCGTPITVVPTSSTSGFAGQCYNRETGEAAKMTLENLTPDLFTTLEVNFNTENMLIEIPQSYFRNNNQVHKVSRKYVVEIFKLPSYDPNSYVLFDELNLVDYTLNQRLVEYSMEDTLYVLTYMKDIANSRASRLASNTSGYYGLSGGSRLNYREHPFWIDAKYSTTTPTNVSSFTIIN
jgi:hypothetical protein